MRLTTLLLIIAILLISTSGFAQKVSLSENNTPLVKVFNKIRQQTGMGFLVSSSMLKDSKSVTIQVSNKDLSVVLKEIFSHQNLDYTIVEKSVIISRKSLPILEEVKDRITVIGQILNEDEQALAGASVKVKNGKSSTKSGTDGWFELREVDRNSILQISFIGYELEEVKAIENRGKVKLSPVTGKLDEIQISANTGYQLVPKERATGSFNVISAKQIQNKIQTNVLERLEGLTPGLMMINGKDNDLDDGLSIRGVSTLFGTKRPLIVVDGFPFEGNINTLNPNDVESITILKDAAAASIWGVRAANGVIVMSTKMGKRGEIEFNYSNSFQFQAKPSLAYLNRLGAADDIAIDNKLLKHFYADAAAIANREAPFSLLGEVYLDFAAGRITSVQYDASLKRLSGQDNTAQIKELLMQSPFTQNHTLSFNGASEKYQYYGSVNYTDQNGYELKDHNSAYNIFFKNRYRISNRLNFGVNVNLNLSNGTRSPVSSIDIFKLKPYNMLQDSKGNPLAIPGLVANSFNTRIIEKRVAWGLGDESYYPLKALNDQEITTKSNERRVQAELNYKISDEIDFSLNYQLEKFSDYNKAYTHAGEAGLLTEINSFITPVLEPDGKIKTNPDGTLFNPTYNLPVGGKIREQKSDGSSQVLQALLKINKTFSPDHQVSAIFGAENRKIQTSGSGLTKYGYDDNTLTSADFDAEHLRKISPNSTLSPVKFSGIQDVFFSKEDRFVSAFANASYSYKNKYVYSGSIRIDQTNLFGANAENLYRPIWSSGLSWIVSNEDFLKTRGLINYLQLRATYGFNGNISKKSGPFMIAASSFNPYNNQPDNRVIVPENKALKWEKTAVTNFGLDFSIFKNRITGKFDYYSKKSSDLLANQRINPTLGFSNAILNTGRMRNDGFEIELHTKNIVKANFEWSTVFTYAFNKSKITKIDSPLILSGSTNAIGRVYLAGAPYDALYSSRYGGLTPNNGQLLMKNSRGKITIGEFDDDLLDFFYCSGTKRPVSSGSLVNKLNYRSLELNFMFVFYLGNVAYQNSASQPEFANLNLNLKSFDKRVMNAWEKPGDEQFTTVPNVILDKNMNDYYSRLLYGNNLDVNVFDASYVKLREIMMIYNFPKYALIRLKYIKGLQLSVHARNLWTLTKNKFGIDPEAFSNGERTMPVMATYALGISLKF